MRSNLKTDAESTNTNGLSISNGNSNGHKSRTYLLLSTSLLVDRVYLHTGLLPGLSSTGDVEIWASSYSDPEGKQKDGRG